MSEKDKDYARGGKKDPLIGHLRAQEKFAKSKEL